MWLFNKQEDFSKQRASNTPRTRIFSLKQTALPHKTILKKAVSSYIILAQQIIGVIKCDIRLKNEP